MGWIADSKQGRLTGAAPRYLVFAVIVAPELQVVQIEVRREGGLRLGGLLRRGLLRHVDDHSFPEDPLRVLRGAQLAARFGFTVAEETVALCRTMDLSALSRERVEGELQKALLQAPRPSIFFRTLDTMHQLRPWFTEVQRLQGVPQPPRYHGEGDVWAVSYTHLTLPTILLV